MKKILLIILTLSLFSCGNEVFKEYHTFSDILWHKSDVVKFDVNVEQAGKYNIYLPVRYTYGCPYKSISIDIKLISPSGKEQTISKEIKIMDSDNKYIGEGAGDIWDTEELAAKDYNLDETGTYKAEISQTTSEETLAFIMEVGLRIEPQNNNK